MGFRNTRVSSDGGDFQPAPAGAHNAVCTRLIDLGTETHPQFGDRRRLQIGFELDEIRDDGERFMVFAHLTLSLHRKSNLLKLLESWRGRGYDDDDEVDITAVIGKPAMLNVQHNHSQDGSRTYANIAGVSPLPRGMTPIQPKGDTICLSLDPEEFDYSEYEKLTDRMKERIGNTPEYKALHNAPHDAGRDAGRDAADAAGAETELNDDIPW